MQVDTVGVEAPRFTELRRECSQGHVVRAKFHHCSYDPHKSPHFVEIQCPFCRENVMFAFNTQYKDE